MTRLKRVSILVGALVLISGGSFFLYQVAYSSGEEVGSNNGYSIGQEEGYNLGEADGYISGKADGYEEGYISGKADGYDEGVEAGLGHGYTLRDPAYSQVVEFLREDKTDENKYIEDTYIKSFRESAEWQAWTK